MAKIVFFGTPDYVVPILGKLSKSHEIAAVVTQSPKPVGRKQLKEYSPVDTWAHKKKVPIYFESAKIVEEKVEAELGVLAAYGEFIPSNVIKYFKYGILNVHPSLLPKWRGASPVQASILAGDSETGVTIIKLDEEMDHGPVVSQFKEEVLPQDLSGSLCERLFKGSAQFLIDMIPNYINSKIKPKEQDHSKATFAKLIKRADGYIPPKYLKSVLQGETLQGTWEIRFMNHHKLEINSVSMNRFIRSMTPWPGAWTEIKILGEKDLPDGKAGAKILRLKILKAHLENPTTGSLRLVPDLVQVEGKNPVSWETFQKGYPGATFG